MRSFGTTPIRRSHDNVPLWLVVRGDDHPKACTGRRLLRHGSVQPLRANRARRPPLLLDPYAATVLSARDRSHGERYGVLVVDCSWNRLSERGGMGPTIAGPGEVRRRLPFLRATNPQHFGRVGELTTAEAFAAALTVLGHEAEARELLSPFHGADAFFEVNAPLFDRYREARSSAAVRLAERAGFADGG